MILTISLPETFITLGRRFIFAEMPLSTNRNSTLLSPPTGFSVLELPTLIVTLSSWSLKLIRLCFNEGFLDLELLIGLNLCTIRLGIFRIVSRQKLHFHLTISFDNGRSPH